MDSSYKDKKLMTGMGIDGILYTFEVVPRKPLPVVIHIRRNFTRNKSDKDFTEPKLVIFIWKGKTGKNEDWLVKLKR